MIHVRIGRLVLNERSRQAYWSFNSISDAKFHRNDDYPDLSKIETIHTQFGDIVIEHGDKHAVDYHNSLRASHPDALFIIYGHTHKHICDMKNKPYVLNPGAAGKTRTQGGASCGLINIDTSGNISVEIKKYTK